MNVPAKDHWANKSEKGVDLVKLELISVSQSFLLRRMRLRFA